MATNFSISDETHGRVERLVKMSGRTPDQIVEAAVGLWEQALLTHMPAEKRSSYKACMLEYSIVTAPPPAPQRPQCVERDDTYVAFDEFDGPAW
jgi:hypothetical protein